MNKNNDSLRLTSADRTTTDADPVLEQVRESLRNLRFGHVQIVVQDGVVVQIDRLERHRISRGERPRN
jgi:hypothetical protein